MHTQIKAIAVVAFALAGTSAGAATFNFAGYGTGPGGNACGQGGLESCVYNNSYAIAKYEFDDGVAGAVETSSVFPSIDGSEFTISFNSGSDQAGTWSYMPSTGDPTIVTAFAIKGGSGGAAIYEWDSSSGTDFSSISFDMAMNVGNFALSNITFWDTTTPPPAPVPLPASALLLLAGVGGFAALRRRKGA